VVAALVLVAAYLLGQFPTADLVAGDRAKGGSGNPGASNVYRQAGRTAGLLVFAGDALKGALAVGLGFLVSRDVASGAGFLAVAGHCFPALRGFRGGKGVATALGAVTVLHPMAPLVAVPAWLLTTAVTRKASLGSLVAVAATATVLVIYGPDPGELLLLAATAALVVARHAGNISRLIRGEERSLR
jgi:glycerol-3-phosphate acyltransferase PlsY